MIRLAQVIFLLLLLFIEVHSQEVRRKHIYNFWVAHKTTKTDTIISYCPIDEYDAGTLPSNEGIEFYRYGKFGYIPAVEKCTYTDCKPQSKMDFDFTRIKGNLYLTLIENSYTWKFFRVEELSKHKMVLKPISKIDFLKVFDGKENKLLYEPTD